MAWNHHNHQISFVLYTFAFRFPVCVFLVCLVAFKHENVYGISAECEQFCEESRLAGHNKEFRAFCGVNGKDLIQANQCPGLCKDNNCDDAMCPDGEFVVCPEVNSANYPRRLDHKERPPRNRKPWSIAAIIGIILGIILISILLVIACIYLYFVMIRKRRVENQNQYQLQAPRTYADGRTPSSIEQSQQRHVPPPNNQQRSSPSTEKVAISSHYMSSEGGVQKIPPKTPPRSQQNFDYTVQPK